tara:strand:+ start:2206 stop:3507 length:1302 start_codon:yes stop_codon:yes gene_type:complete
MFNNLNNFVKSEGFLKYFKNTSLLLTDKVLRIFIGLFVGVWVAKYLGPNQFGVFAYVNSVVGLFSAIAAMGLNELIVQKIVIGKYDLNEILGTAFYLKIGGFLATLVCIIITMFIIDSDYYTKSLIIILTFGFLFQSFNVIEFYFQSQVDSKYILIINSGALVISTLIKIICILLKADLLLFVVITSLDFLIMSVGYVFFYKRKTKLSISDWKWECTLAKKLLKESWPLIISSLSFVVYNNIDKIMLKSLLDDYSVGIYSAATRLVIPWQFIPGLIISSFMPALVRGYEDSLQLFNYRIKYLGSFLIWISFILVFLYTFFSEELIFLTFGSDYRESANITVYLIWTNVFVFFNSLWNRWMMIENNTKITFYFSLITSVLNVILNYFMITTYGVKGACFALLISLTITSFVFYVIIDSRVIKLFFKSLLFIKNR